MTMPALPPLRMTGTDLLEYAFCPRFIYYENFLEIPEHQERRYKVLRGREIHEEKQRLNRDYLRRKIGCTGRKIGLRLHAADGLYSGEVDEILFLDDGSAAPLDYKWAEWKGRVFDTHRLQLAFYAELIRQNFNQPVHQAFLVYVQSKNRLITLPLGLEEQHELASTMETIHRIRTQGWYPPPASTAKRCSDCCYRLVCERI